MSSRVVAGAEDLPPTEPSQHDNNKSIPDPSSEAPPPYTSAAQPPVYNDHNSPPPSFAAKLLPKWYKRRRIQILLFAFLITVVLAASLGKSLNDRADRSPSASLPTPTGPFIPYDRTKAAVHGLAAAECEAGTFVVWKHNKYFWWKGVVRNGVGEWDIPKQLVLSSGPLKQTELVNMTATCWEIDTGDASVAQKIGFKWIYSENEYGGGFSTINTIITLPIVRTGVPTIEDATSRGIEYRNGYDVSSLAVASITPPLGSSNISLHYLLYLVPRNQSQPQGPADIVSRGCCNGNSMSGWTPPRILNATAMSATVGIAIARVDGGLHNGNRTELHVVFGGEEGRLMYMNWTLANDWSAEVPVYDLSNTPMLTPPSPFVLTIPFAQTARDVFEMPQSVSQPNRSNYARLNLYWISQANPTWSYFTSPSQIKYASLTYLPSTSRMCTRYTSVSAEFGHGLKPNLALTEPAYLAVAAYDPTFISQKSSSATLPTYGQYLESKERNERVQLFFVEAEYTKEERYDENRLLGGMKIANYTWQKSSDPDWGGWAFYAGPRVVWDAAALT